MLKNPTRSQRGTEGDNTPRGAKGPPRGRSANKTQISCFDYVRDRGFGSEHENPKIQLRREKRGQPGRGYQSRINRRGVVTNLGGAGANTGWGASIDLGPGSVSRIFGELMSGGSEGKA